MRLVLIEPEQLQRVFLNRVMKRTKSTGGRNRHVKKAKDKSAADDKVIVPWDSVLDELYYSQLLKEMLDHNIINAPSVKKVKRKR